MESNNPYAPPQANLDLPPTPDGYPLASRWMRFVGALADGICSGIVFLVVALIFVGGSNFSHTFARIGSREEPISFGAEVMIVVAGMVIWLALNGYLIHTRGQTIGKVMVGTKIVRRDGSQATFGRVFLFRFLPMQAISIIPFVGAIVPLIDVLMIFRGNRACLHDDIADTKVIKL